MSSPLLETAPRIQLNPDGLLQVNRNIVDPAVLASITGQELGHAQAVYNYHHAGVAVPTALLATRLALSQQARRDVIGIRNNTWTKGLESGTKKLTVGTTTLLKLARLPSDEGLRLTLDLDTDLSQRSATPLEEYLSRVANEEYPVLDAHDLEGHGPGAALAIRPIRSLMQRAARAVLGFDRNDEESLGKAGEVGNALDQTTQDLTCMWGWSIHPWSEPRGRVFGGDGYAYNFSTNQSLAEQLETLVRYGGLPDDATTDDISKFAADTVTAQMERIFTLRSTPFFVADESLPYYDYSRTIAELLFDRFGPFDAAPKLAEPDKLVQQDPWGDGIGRVIDILDGFGALLPSAGIAVYTLPTPPGPEALITQHT